MAGTVQASTLPKEAFGTLASLAGIQGVRRVEIGDSDYVAVSRTLALTPTGEGATVATKDFPTAIILRSRTDRLRFLSAVHREIFFTTIVAVLAATLVSYGIARTVTRPLGNDHRDDARDGRDRRPDPTNPGACAGGDGRTKTPSSSRRPSTP